VPAAAVTREERALSKMNRYKGYGGGENESL